MNPFKHVSNTFKTCAAFVYVLSLHSVIPHQFASCFASIEMATTSVTRKRYQYPCFENVCDFTGNQLPTYEDIIKSILYRKTQLKSATGKDASVTNICKELTQEIVQIYERASIPCLSSKRISDLLFKYHSKYQSLLKPYKSRKNEKSFQDKMEAFSNEAKFLFDFSSCKCFSFASCCCPKEKKVPKLEQAFLLDQRADRKLFIGSIDKSVSGKLSERAKRKRREQAFLEKADKSEMLLNPLSASEEDTTTSGSTTDDEFLPSRASVKRICHKGETISQNRVEGKEDTVIKAKSLPLFAEACDRIGLSDRGAALVSTSLLEDVGLVKRTLSDNIIDRHKVRRERMSRRTTHIKSETISIISSLYFDGKKDITLINKKKGSKFYKRKVTEEHITLISEPESRYLAHFTPGTGTARSIYSGILRVLESKDISLDSLIAIGCDGTNVNTGTKGGIIKLIEDDLQRPLHWFICMLHGNELPLRNLFLALDGKTSGPRAFTGIIGKELQKCELGPVASFNPIDASIDVPLSADLSTDQKYLYDIHRAIASGNVPNDLTLRSPGCLNHARWLTTANRILRLYVTKEDPTDNLKLLAHFVMTVYAPMWFQIKTNPFVNCGAKHIFETIKLVKEQDDRVQSIVMPVVMRNAFFAHPENLLLTMLSDERPHIRELGWMKIKRARSAANNPGIRTFKIPEINIDCKDYMDLINWQSTVVTEPPMTMHFSDNEINEFIRNKKHFECERYPLHTQAVERTIKIVSDVSSQVCSHEAREGLIHSRLASRLRISKFDSKKDYMA